MTNNLSLSEFCRQRDRLKEELKWARCNVMVLEAEWDKLHKNEGGEELTLGDAVEMLEHDR